MKFNSKLDFYENLRARRNDRSHHIEQQTCYEDLSAEERSRLMALNEQLKQLEEKYLPIMNAKGAELQARVSDPADWMQDFNLEFILTFYLHEDDPEYDEDDDNILMQLEEIVFDYDEPQRAYRNWGFGMTSTNHCESFLREMNDGEHHCYLYHQLYDHCDLDWRDLLRIGELWVDVKIEEQSGMLPIIVSTEVTCGSGIKAVANSICANQPEILSNKQDV